MFGYLFYQRYISSLVYSGPHISTRNYFFHARYNYPQKKSRISPTLWQDILRLPKFFIIFVIILFILDLSTLNKLLLIARAQEILIVKASSIPQYIVLLYAFFNIVRAGSEFLLGLISDYVNRIVLLAFFGSAILALEAFLLLAPQANFIYCLAIFALAGINASTVMTLKKASAADMLPGDIRGLGYGVLQASEGFAALIANFLIHLVDALLSFRSLFLYYCSESYCYAYIDRICIFAKKITYNKKITFLHL